MSDSKVTVIGDRNSVLGFSALGVRVLTPKMEDVRESIIMAVRDDTVVVFITEKMAETVPELIKELSQRPLPSVVVIPDASGSQGMGLDKLDDIIVRAVGAHLAMDEHEEQS
jgi:V/A-type H+-transporting ATPase subunit F